VVHHVRRERFRAVPRYTCTIRGGVLHPREGRRASGASPTKGDAKPDDDEKSDQKRKYNVETQRIEHPEIGVILTLQIFFFNPVIIQQSYRNGMVAGAF
tara:strand:- start:1847 stop:2143 length:297 start_codon:yes stop_codon:yes gene_type:complete